MENKHSNREQITLYFLDLQDAICRQLETADGEGRFLEDSWQRDGGGGGRTRVIQGKHIEKGGVNFSAVHGGPSHDLRRMLNTEATAFYATGVSIVLHPVSPLVPIIHMNVRYFELNDGTWWFGGGIDLTPHYVVPDDARFFHQQLKNVCDAADPGFYRRFKECADRYFYIRHPEETRGIGGVFFDRLRDENHTKDSLFAFVQAVGETFAPTYVPLLHKYKDLPYTREQKEWQLIRRGRYAEFNLVWDAGTKFGLETNGRTESILMSLPPQANWQYAHKPAPDTPEAYTVALLKQGIDWVNYTESK